MSFAIVRWRSALSLLCLASLVGCVTAPQGPRVAVMPTPGKPLDLFSAEDQYCRGYAQQTLGPDTRNDAAVGSAVVGTILGAAIGSALGGRHDRTASGAATGLMMGTMIGAGNSAAEGHSAQQRYDIAYEQCMVSKNNQPSRAYYRRQGAPVVIVPQASPYGAPPPNAPPPYPMPPPPPGQAPPPAPQ